MSVAIVGAILLIEAPWRPTGCDTIEPTRDRADARPAPDLCGASAWLTEPYSLHHRGDVVLVDFWTYSCINCIRTLPHLTAWDAAYADHGLVIIGVHSPEFAFEKDADNVRDAMERHGIQYRVVQDNDHTIWGNYQNRFWPAKYLIDADGNIRYTHFGEGAYEETEAVIRTLLVEAGQTDLPPPVEDGVEPAPVAGPRTPELYAGYARQDWTVGNVEGYRPDEDVTYAWPDTRRADRLYLDGTWHNGGDALTAVKDAALRLRFTAGAANLVADGSGCVPILIDGQTPPDGYDVRDGCLELDGARSYDFYGGDFGTFEVELHFPAGASLYTFAFSNEPVP